MSRWWRAEDTSIDHPKLLRLSDAMHRAWYTLMCISSANGGCLPPVDDIALRLRMKPGQVAAWITHLVTAGLFDNDNGTFRPHNWDRRQYKTDVTDPTNAARQKRYRDRHRNDSNAVTDKRPETEQRQSITDTLPVVAGRAVDPPVSKKRASRLPTDWQPSERSYQIAEQFGQNVQIVEGIFRDYCASSGKLYADHDAAFHNFIRNQKTFNRGSGDAKPKNGIIQAADDLRRKLASFDGPPRRVDELRSGEGGPALRLLSNGGSE
jgi:hypothetical protein